MSARATVLAVFAHPDDESLACGGTLARLASENARTVLFCASRGERGAATGPARDDALADRRSRELRCAAEALGIRDLLLFNHPDGDLRWAEVGAFLAEIVMAVQRFRPSAVITFGEDGLYWHLDHVGVYERTTAAIRLLGADAPPLYYVTMARNAMPAIVGNAKARGWMAPPKGFWSLAPESFGLAAEEASVIIDVSPWAEQKLAAIRCHRTQTAADDPFGMLTAEQARQWLGIEHFHRAPTETRMPPFLEQLARSSTTNSNP
jgi:N-acetyl-1-D-myo-inositol-2-amino-2-deoxy-alpha-D-glucopyranoside deacetylase